MPSLRYVTAGVTILLTFLALDTFWIGFVALPMFRAALGDLLYFRWEAGLAFYLVYVCGVLFFAIHPAFKSGQWKTAAIHGAVLGFVAYATYDLTNLSTLKDWSLGIALPDMAWGTVMTSAGATLGYALSAPLMRLLKLRFPKR